MSPFGNDPELFAVQVLTRPDAWYLRSSSQDTDGTWWPNEFVQRLDLPVDAESLLTGIQAAKDSTRRDLPAPGSWADSPDDPGKKTLLRAAGVKSITAFSRGAGGVSILYYRTRITVSRLIPVPGGFTATAEFEDEVAPDDPGALTAAIMKQAGVAPET